MFIPYAKHFLDEDDINSVVEVLRSDYLTCGPKIDEFEKALCKVTGAKYCVAISNGTAALHAACFAAGIGDGDEVITTPMTFAASANAVLYMGATPVFADIDPLTYNINPTEIEKKITNKTKAIIPVDYTGQPCDMDRIWEIAKRHGLKIIQDAAHSIGGGYKGRPVGSYSDMTTFSFHPAKHVSCGEGGAITTDDPELYKRLLLFRTHGITRDKSLLINNEGGWFYEQQELGYNYRITDIQAALGLSQLKKLDGYLKRRKEIVKKYNEAFSKNANVTIPHVMDGCSSAWHLYVIKLGEALNRKEVYDALHAFGVGVNVHYVPVYLHPYYQKLGYENGLCPAAEDLYSRIISLPLYNTLSDELTSIVIEAVLKSTK